nr:beta-propeller fold lactonase family protein [Verrucomicrobium spinosum]
MKLPRTLRLTALAALLPLGGLSAAHDQLVYIGTYTGAKNAKVESKGIYVFGFDSESGRLEPMGLAGEVKSPSFLAISPSRKYLYSVSEAPMGAASPGKPATGGVSSFSIDQKTGKLTLLNQESSGGSGPCHVSVDHTGKTLLVANYGSGHVASLPVKDDAPWPPRPRCTSMSPPPRRTRSVRKGPTPTPSTWMLGTNLPLPPIWAATASSSTNWMPPKARSPPTHPHSAPSPLAGGRATLPSTPTASTRMSAMR